MGRPGLSNASEGLTSVENTFVWYHGMIGMSLCVCHLTKFTLSGEQAN